MSMNDVKRAFDLFDLNGDGTIDEKVAFICQFTQKQNKFQVLCLSRNLAFQ